VPTRKYRGLDRDPIDGRPLYWGAHPDGLPVREGDSPSLVDAHQAANASANLFFRSEILSIPKDLERYIEIWDWIVNGMASLKFEDRQPVADKPGEYSVWLAWIDIRGYIPSRLPPEYAAAVGARVS
jgi:hypothetical protein